MADHCKRVETILLGAALDRELLRGVSCSSSFRGIAFVSETAVIGSIDNTLLLIRQKPCAGACQLTWVTAYKGEQGEQSV